MSQCPPPGTLAHTKWIGCVVSVRNKLDALVRQGVLCKAQIKLNAHLRSVICARVERKPRKVVSSQSQFIALMEQYFNERGWPSEEEMNMYKQGTEYGHELTLRIPVALYRAMVFEATRMGVKLADLARMVLTMHFDKKEAARAKAKAGTPTSK